MQTTLYPNIKAELARYDSSTAELAEYMGMSRQNLNGKLNGKILLNAKDMKKIREFFVVKFNNSFTMDYLFTESLKNYRKDD